MEEKRRKSAQYTDSSGRVPQNVSFMRYDKKLGKRVVDSGEYDGAKFAELLLEAKGGRSVERFSKAAGVATALVQSVLDGKRTTPLPTEDLIRIAKVAKKRPGTDFDSLFEANGYRYYTGKPNVKSIVCFMRDAVGPDGSVPEYLIRSGGYPTMHTTYVEHGLKNPLCHGFVKSLVNNSVLESKSAYRRLFVANYCGKPEDGLGKTHDEDEPVRRRKAKTKTDEAPAKEPVDWNDPEAFVPVEIFQETNEGKPAPEVPTDERPTQEVPTAETPETDVPTDEEAPVEKEPAKETSGDEKPQDSSMPNDDPSWADAICGALTFARELSFEETEAFSKKFFAMMKNPKMFLFFAKLTEANRSKNGTANVEMNVEDFLYVLGRLVL